MTTPDPAAVAAAFRRRTTGDYAYWPAVFQRQIDAELLADWAAANLPRAAGLEADLTAAVGRNVRLVDALKVARSAILTAQDEAMSETGPNSDRAVYFDGALKAMADALTDQPPDGAA